MLCQKCKKNNANVFYKETVNGQTKSYAYCAQCAEEAQKNGEVNFNMESPFDSEFFKPFQSIDNILGSIFSAPHGQLSGGKNAIESPARSSEKKCGLCGATIRDLAREGKTGCPKCYETFTDELADSISRIHGNVTHIGRAPKLLKDKLDRTKKLRQLKSELQKAIEAQEFEKAAELRDNIRTLEQ